MNKISFLTWSPFAIFSLVALFTNCRNATKIELGPAKTFAIDTIVQPIVANEHTRALSLAILKDGQTHYYNYGIISTQINEAPTSKSIYEIGSVSKTFTTTVLARSKRRNCNLMSQLIITSLAE